MNETLEQIALRVAELEIEVEKCREDAEKWRAHQRRKNDLINGGLLKSPLRSEFDLQQESPIDVLTGQAVSALASQIDEEIYKSVRHFIEQSKKKGNPISEARSRGRVVCRPDKIEVFCMDDTPLLEIHPVSVTWQGTKATFTRNFKRLYGKENS